MTTVPNLDRATTNDGAAWRTCTTCGTLAAAAPDQTVCGTCRPAPTTRPVVRLLPGHFAPDDLFHISMAGSVFAAAIADIAHHDIGDPGFWDCYGTAPDELDRLGDALDRMQTAIRTTRAELATIRRRANRKARLQASQRANREGQVNH